MAEEYYVKLVLGKWFEPRIKKTVEVYAHTHEITQAPNREKILTIELLRDFPDAGRFNYYDDQKEEYVEGMAVYPKIKIGSGSIREITDDSKG
ncbi:MAG: hypothetical protein WAN47_01425 [Nitrosotalea sp.]